MPVTIAIPGALRQFANEHTELEVRADTVGDALTELTNTYPELRHHLYIDARTLRNFINVYLNEEDIRHLQGFDTAAKDGDLVTIVPAIAGGAYFPSWHPEARFYCRRHRTIKPACVPVRILVKD